MSKREYPRSFFFKVYKAMCNMLDVECICYGKTCKNSKFECIYGIDSCGFKKPLRVKIVNGRNALLNISEARLRKEDRQKEIVKTVMKAVEKSDVWVEGGNMFDDMHVIPARTCFEEHVIEHDLRQGLDA